MLTVRSCSLCKSIVEKDPASAPEPVQDAVEDAVPLLVLVEAQMQEIAHVAGGLRDAKRVHAFNIPNQWVGRAGLVAVRVPQKCGEVTGGSEAQAGNERIPRRVGELVQPPLCERCPGGQQPDTERVDVLPVSGGDGHRRIVVSRTHREAGPGLVHRRCRIGQRRDDRRGVVDDEFLERRADDRRAVRILRDRHSDRQAVAAGSHARIPAAGDDGVALAHEKAVACVGSARRIIAAASVVEDAENAD